MTRIIVALCAILACVSSAWAQQKSGAAPPDPMLLQEHSNTQGNSQTSSFTPRVQTYNGANRNLALIMIGQSNCANVNPTAYIPASSAIDQLNIYDGGSYNFTSAGMLGPTNDGTVVVGGGLGNVGGRVAQLLITNNIFDHIVVESICVGSSPACGWANSCSTFGAYYLRIPVAMARFKSRGITPTTSSWTFAVSWWQGEQDTSLSTTALSYETSMATIMGVFQANGFNCATCRFFVNEQSWIGGAVSTAVETAQAAVVTSYPTFFFTGGNIDSLGAGNRLADNTHLNDTGAAAAATLVYNAMVASGAPF